MISNVSLFPQNSIRHNLSLHSRFVRVQNEGTGKSSWWTINPDALPVNSHTRRSSGGGSGNGSSASTTPNLCGPTLSILSGNGGKNSRRRANTLDSTIPRTIDKRARGTNTKPGNRRRGDSGNAVCRISSNGYMHTHTNNIYIYIYIYIYSIR